MSKVLTSTERAIQAHADIDKLKSRNPNHNREPSVPEPISERAFVRLFGTKVWKVRYSGRTDFVGLIVAGRNTGFWIVRDNFTGERKLHVIDIVNGEVKITGRIVPLRHSNSLAHLQRGLLNWVT